ncbi:MAG: hypothetical protein ACOYYJ_15745 [Chloroflexota bacterium]
MKDHYDFSVAERGKFYRADAEFHFPVYLEADVHEFLAQLAEQRSVDMNELVNNLLRADISIIQNAAN